MNPTVTLSELKFADEKACPVTRELVDERPVALEYNGIAYAVMMATPSDLEDYVVGFSLGEGLIEAAAEVLDLAVHEGEAGWILRVTLPEHRAAPLRERVRVRLVEGSCGLCGLESLEQVMRPLSKVELGFHTTPAAVHRALIDLPARQVRGVASRAMHAAAFCAPDGSIRHVREDVGRHNALDKLLGALARDGVDPASGFIVVSARCSYELVEKTVRAGCAILVAISAPTALAAERAGLADLTLLALARHDTMLVVNDPHALMKGTCDGL